MGELNETSCNALNGAWYSLPSKVLPTSISMTILIISSLVPKLGSSHPTSHSPMPTLPLDPEAGPMSLCYPVGLQPLNQSPDYPHPLLVTPWTVGWS